MYYIDAILHFFLQVSASDNRVSVQLDLDRRRKEHPEGGGGAHDEVEDEAASAWSFGASFLYSLSLITTVGTVDPA